MALILMSISIGAKLDVTLLAPVASPKGHEMLPLLLHGVPCGTQANPSPMSQTEWIQSSQTGNGLSINFMVFCETLVMSAWLAWRQTANGLEILFLHFLLTIKTCRAVGCHSSVACCRLFSMQALFESHGKGA